MLLGSILKVPYNNSRRTAYFFLPRDAIAKHGICYGILLFVCPSVCLSLKLQLRLVIVLKWRNISSDLFSTEITRRMAIANGTCVSFCYQPKAHFGLPWYAPGTIAVNVTWMKRGFQCSLNASQHVPIYLQPFPSNSTRKFKSSLF